MGEAERMKEDIDDLQGRMRTLEEELVTIARMDENITFIKQRLEDGLEKFSKTDNRIEKLEKTISKHERFIEEHPGMCKELNELKIQFTNYKASNQGKWVGASTIIVVFVGLINMLLLLFTLYRMFLGVPA